MVMEKKFSFDRLSYDRLKKIVTLGCGGGSAWNKRGRSLDVCEILWSSSLHTLHNVIVI